MTTLSWRSAGKALAVLLCAAGLLSLGPAAPTPAPVPARAPVVADPREAVRQAVRQAVRDHPEDAGAWSSLAHLELELSRTTLDASHLPRAERALRRSLRLRPHGNYAAVTGYGALANAQHDFATGRTYGRRAVRMGPRRPAGYAVLAEAEIQLGHYAPARTALQRLLDLDPTSAAFARAGYDLQLHGRDEEAVLAYERAAQDAGNGEERAFAEYHLGELAWEAGHPAEAGGHFRRALASEPGHPYATAGRARVAAGTGHDKEALRAYTRLVARLPLPRFLLELGELRLAGGQRAAAERQFAVLDAQVRLAESEGGAFDPLLGLYEADHGDADRAVRLLRGEWRRRQHVDVADALSWALHRAGRNTEALTYARRAEATGRRNALAAYHYGVIEIALGMPEGEPRLRRVLDRHPHFSPYHAPRAARLAGIALPTDRSER